jgi:predicted nucleic acid-binding protein
MLYLDASALIKKYLGEKGSPAIRSRFESGERIFTSMLSYGEVHASIARKFRSKELDASELSKLREEFENDWFLSLSVLELDTRTMSALPQIVEKYSLRAGDAIHLAAAFWLEGSFEIGTTHSVPEVFVEFGVADRRLALIAHKCGLRVFNPEDEN